MEVPVVVPGLFYIFEALMNKENRNNKAAVAVLFCGFVFTYLVVQWQFGIFTQPYFWDELGVYSRSSTHLFYHGLSLMPSSIPDELSRGHPLLCSFYFALAFKIFGCSPVTAHFAAAFLNMLGFYFCYRIFARYIPSWHAVFATMAVFVQPLFLSQSVLILPEMPLMVCTLGAVMCYVYERKWGLMLFLVAALQVKESALVLPMAFLLADILIDKKPDWKGLLGYFIIPILSFVIFISVQKFQRGYFFYPLHTSLSSFDMYFINERWQNFKQYFLHEQGRYAIWVLGCIVAVIYMVRNGGRLRSLLTKRLIVLPVIIAGSLCFLVLNYYLSRYTMYFVVLFYIMLLLLIYKTFRKYLYLQVILVGLILCNGIYNWNNGRQYTDVDFSYSDHVRTLLMTVEELKSNSYRGKVVAMDFPFSAAYWNRDNGYNTGENVRSVPVQDSLPLKDYYIFTHPGNMADTGKYENIVFEKELRWGYAFTRIYKVIKPSL
jgi:hypothetical protein